MRNEELAVNEVKSLNRLASIELGWYDKDPFEVVGLNTTETRIIIFPFMSHKNCINSVPCFSLLSVTG